MLVLYFSKTNNLTEHNLFLFYISFLTLRKQFRRCGASFVRGASLRRDTFGGMPSQRMFWDTFCAIEPAAIERRPLALVRPLTRPGEPMSAFAQGGLEQISETSLTVRMDFDNFDNYWKPLITGHGTLASFLSTLPVETTDKLKSGVRAAYLCGGSEGARSFATTAVAARGIVPG
jgi:hypothetical protein